MIHISRWICMYCFAVCCGRGTHVYPVVSSEVENIVCSQPSTCLTCWPWCYSVQPCHRMTSVTHGSLSSLPPHPRPTTPPYRHKFCLTVLAFHPSVCSPLSVFTFLVLSLLQGLYLFFFFLSFFFFYHFAIFSHISSLSSVSHSSASFPRPIPGGPRRAAGDDSCISSRLRGHSRSAPLRLNRTVWATETKREEDEGIVNGKILKNRER